MDDASINRFAQYLYEEVNARPSLELAMPMTAKSELVDAIKAALGRI